MVCKQPRSTGLQTARINWSANSQDQLVCKQPRSTGLQTARINWSANSQDQLVCKQPRSTGLQTAKINWSANSQDQLVFQLGGWMGQTTHQHKKLSCYKMLQKIESNGWLC
jgi:hypothetical protein